MYLLDVGVNLCVFVVFDLVFVFVFWVFVLPLLPFECLDLLLLLEVFFVLV